MITATIGDHSIYSITVPKSDSWVDIDEVVFLSDPKQNMLSIGKTCFKASIMITYKWLLGTSRNF